jgi:hypothetical protein
MFIIEQKINKIIRDYLIVQVEEGKIYLSMNFNRIGKIENVTSEKLKEIFGDGYVTITISLPD